MSSPHWRLAPIASRWCAIVVALLSFGLLLGGCINPPDIVMLDRKTVLEEQASGELYALEDELRELVIVPKGADYTRGQLAAVGADMSHANLDVITQVHALLRQESEFLDDLLVRRCVGEARSGLVVETPGNCAGRADARRISAAVQRVNRARRQLWLWLQEQRPERSEDEMHHNWLEHHRASIACGGQIESEAGEWEVKPC